MTEPLWTLDDLVAAAAGTRDDPADTKQNVGGREGHVSGISIDTRSLASGDLFVALKDARDGHEFVPTAFAKGAAAALVADGYRRQPGDGILIRVDDTLRALERIGRAARVRLPRSARVVAVTGSAGKTGTKEMLRSCLQAGGTTPGRVHAPEKSFNNHWGVPLTLARMPRDTEYAVFEIGMNHANEIRPLTKLVAPHVAVVTNVLPVHVGNFPDGELGVAQAKAEVFEGLVQPGIAVIPSDSTHFARLAEAAMRHAETVITFGAAPESDVRLESVSDLQANGCQNVVAVTMEPPRRLAFDMALIGRHLAVNAMAVLATMCALDLDPGPALPALAGVQSSQGRGQRMALEAGDERILLLDESYNANPASMAAALANLAATPTQGRRLAVMGDMLELGEDAVAYHTGLLPGAQRADLVFCCGPAMKHLFAAIPAEKRGAWAPTSAELVAQLVPNVRSGDTVMVKGSLGSRMAQVVDAIKKRFAPA
ncbi:MAG: UDP-N-acetylmuramoyl-tripeptide--D-alanyl-D-alanine ligase [Hyphomicrobiaceae bacterium]